ncbi:MAG: hypothetical protein QME40_04595 [bacterium]|nr:hypothetical protein [bacterium]
MIQDLETLIKGGLKPKDKIEIIKIYEDLFREFWEKLTNSLDPTTTVFIVKRALKKTQEQHPVLCNLEITETGICLSRLNIDGVEIKEIVSAFRELATNLFAIVTKLTGGIIMDKLL